MLRLLSLAICAQSALAAVTMPRWFGDYMVLQTNAEYGARSFLNGKAKPSEHVTVQIGGGLGGAYPTIADADGDWIIQANHAHGTVTVHGEDGPTLTAHNVSSGDVFFCSGQSNMVFPTKFTLNASAEIATLANYPQFRFFATARDYASTPQFDLKMSGPHWACDAKPCNQWLTTEMALKVQPGKLPKSPLPNTFIANFSAVCFMTVRDIAKMHTCKTGQCKPGRPGRPMALIQSAWGGTRVEAWMPTAAIEAAAQKVAPPNVFMPPKKKEQNNVSVLYNAMVAPWDKFAVRASIWYQGEANADQKPTAANKAKGDTLTNYYAAYLQEMAASWREKKGMGDFAFLPMMLPPSVPAGTPLAKQLTTGRMEVRLAEQEVAPHSNGLTDISGVPVTVDLGGKSAWGFDHPPNKNEMSRRLALQTVHAAYAQQGRISWTSPSDEEETVSSLWTGPIFTGAKAGLAMHTVVLSFLDWSATGMKLLDVKAANPDGTRNDCTLCCAKMAPFETSTDGKSWTRVSAVKTSIAGSKVTLTAAAVVAHVRYAWSDYVDCVLVNNDSLPLAPFVWDHASKVQKQNQNKVSKPAVPAAVASESWDHRGKPSGPSFSPPMGFNSWNYYHCNIDENTVKAVMDAFVTNGMRDAGYEYVNIDDCWQVERFANATIQPDPARFPSGMKHLADYAHSRGLKFGVYTARGSRTCQGRPGAYGNEALDAKTYCDWGLDYLKNDNCGGTNWPAQNTSWIKFQQGFDECYKKTGRYIVKSIEYCKDPAQCGQWIGGVANTWRTVGDVQAVWSSVMGNIHANNKMAAVVNGGQGKRNGQGNFNDADMLEIGNVGLSVTEQYSMMSLWSLASAPLLAGTDIVGASNTTLAILANKEVTAINQDLGKGGALQGIVVSTDPEGKTEVWCKWLADGKSVAVVLLNMGANTTSVTAQFTDLKLSGSASVRDLWNAKDLPAASGSLSATVPSHGTAMFKLTPK